MKRMNILILTCLVLLSYLAAGCTANTLPQRAEQALDEEIATLENAETAYQIVSVEKGDTVQEINLEGGLIPESNQAGVCPPAGTSETWCVVISPYVMDKEGTPISHFLISRQGSNWHVQQLTEQEEKAFLYLGCENWTAPGSERESQ